jgi:hypothetical protein
MSNSITETLRSIANNFIALADELDNQNNEIQNRISYVETVAVTSNQALKDAAALIIDKLN